jgi:hypothetical protein
MNELFRKLTTEVKQKMAEILATNETKSVIDATKAASDSGNFEVVISTADIDRQGESINQEGWDLSNYLKNPVVLWGHDYYSLPIGICESIAIIDGKLVARGRFAPEAANPFAQQVRRLYDAGIVRATSVGLIVLEMEGHIVTKAELLEFSFVPVPANPYALSLSKAKELGLNLEMIAIKGLKLETKAMGDECTMDDGSMGTMQDDGNGGMMCKPKSAKAEGDPCNMDDGTEGMIDSQGVCKPKAAKDADEKSPACRQADETKAECVSRKIPEIMAEDSSMTQDQAIAIAEGVCETACEAKQASVEPKAVEKKDAQQVGAILAQLQNVIDNAIVTAAKLILSIIQSEFGKSEAGQAEIKAAIKTNESIKSIKDTIGNLEKKLGIAEGEEHPSGGAPKQRSEDAGVVATIKSLDDFLAARELLKSISTFANQSLERMNEKMRQEREARKH